MMTAPDLFRLPAPVPPPYQRHSLTSYKAAEAVKSSAQADRARVLAYLVTQGELGATDDEMQLLWNWKDQRRGREG